MHDTYGTSEGEIIVRNQAFSNHCLYLSNQNHQLVPAILMLMFAGAVLISFWEKTSGTCQMHPQPLISVWGHITTMRGTSPSNIAMCSTFGLFYVQPQSAFALPNMKMWDYWWGGYLNQCFRKTLEKKSNGSLLRLGTVEWKHFGNPEKWNFVTVKVW